MKNLLVGGVLVLTLVIGWLLLPESASQSDEDSQLATIQLRDAHGLAVDRNDSTKVYIATHSGLLIMDPEGELQRVGHAQDDYMGFSVHPTDANTFYTSGHIHTGGNIGFQKSTDGGNTWQKISDGVNGPVDFHVMTVSQVNPNVIYGVYSGRLQRSVDEGKNWEIVSAAPAGIFTLATSPTAADSIYAGTTDGLYVSKNQGQNWTKLENTTSAVTSLATHPLNGEELLVYTQAQGLIRSRDGGVNWARLSGYDGSIVMHLAYDPNKPETAYLIDQNLEIYRTTDSSETWTKIT